MDISTYHDVDQSRAAKVEIIIRTAKKGEEKLLTIFGEFSEEKNRRQAAPRDKKQMDFYFKRRDAEAQRFPFRV